MEPSIGKKQQGHARNDAIAAMTNAAADHAARRYYAGDNSKCTVAEGNLPQTLRWQPPPETRTVKDTQAPCLLLQRNACTHHTGSSTMQSTRGNCQGLGHTLGETSQTYNVARSVVLPYRENAGLLVTCKLPKGRLYDAKKFRRPPCCTGSAGVGRSTPPDPQSLGCLLPVAQAMHMQTTYIRTYTTLIPVFQRQ